MKQLKVNELVNIKGGNYCVNAFLGYGAKGAVTGAFRGGIQGAVIGGTAGLVGGSLKCYAHYN